MLLVVFYEQAPPKGLRLAVIHSPTRLLFPFALPAGAPAPPSPNSFIPPHALPHLTRRQLAEAFVRLAREPEQPSVTEARVHELVLEYIGRRWRAESAVVESIARKLADVELEVSIASCPVLREADPRSCSWSHLPHLWSSRPSMNSASNSAWSILLTSSPGWVAQGSRPDRQGTQRNF